MTNSKMTIAMFFAVLISLVMGDSSQAQPVIGNRLKSPLPSNTELSRFGLQRMWWGQAVLNPSRDVVTHVTIDEESVIVQASSGMVTSFDSETGAKMWNVQIGRSDQPAFKAVTNFSSVMIVSGNKMISIDRKKGKVLWELPLPGAPSTPPELDDNHVFFGTIEGEAAAFNLKKAEKLYSEGKLPSWAYQTRSWKYPIGNVVISNPVHVKDNIFFADKANSIHALNVNTGKMVFQFESDTPISAPMAADGEKLYFASKDTSFYCVNAENGKTFWSFAAGFQITQKPRVIEENIYIVPDQAGLIAINKKTGKEIWPTPQKSAIKFTASTKQYVFARDVLHNVLVLNKKNGRTVGVLPLKKFQFNIENERTDRIVLVSTRGLVTVIREKDHKFPLYYKFPNRRPILPRFASEMPEPDTAEPDAPTGEKDSF